MNKREIAREGEATFIKSLSGFRGEAQLWRVSPPLKGYSWGEEEAESYEYVAISGVHAMFSGPETYIFAADSEGNVTDWGELPGSFKGSIDHEQALHNAGYDTLIYEVGK